MRKVELNSTFRNGFCNRFCNVFRPCKVCYIGQWFEKLHRVTAPLREITHDTEKEAKNNVNHIQSNYLCVTQFSKLLDNNWKKLVLLLAAFFSCASLSSYSKQIIVQYLKTNCCVPLLTILGLRNGIFADTAILRRVLKVDLHGLHEWPFSIITVDNNFTCKTCDLLERSGFVGKSI